MPGKLINTVFVSDLALCTKLTLQYLLHLCSFPALHVQWQQRMLEGLCGMYLSDALPAGLRHAQQQAQQVELQSVAHEGKADGHQAPGYYYGGQPHRGTNAHQY